MTDAPAQRVRRVLEVASRIRDADDPLGREARSRLAACSGLSREGVELALSEHLETSAGEAELASFVASVAAADRTWVVLAANVCTAAVRAVAWALAAAPVVRVKPSRRDPVVAELLVGRLAEALDVALVDELDVAPHDSVHAYGSDDTLAAIAASLPSEVRLVGHGSGIGVAVIEDDDDARQAAAALADDLVVFDGRGCLSPRIALVAGDRIDAIASALHRELLGRGERVPRGELTSDEQAQLSAYRQLARAVGSWLEGPHHGIAVDPAATAVALPPAHRCIAILALDGAVDAVLADVARHVTCIGRLGDGPRARALMALCPQARVCTLGRMQKPPLDGPVDRRVWSAGDVKAIAAPRRSR